jgi:hypothetical protein
MGINWESHKESLQLLLNSGASYEEMGRKYNCSGANIKKVLKKLGFTLSPRRTINSKEHFNKCVYTKKWLYCGNIVTNKHSIFCSRKCNSEYRRENYYKDYLNNQDTFYGRKSMRFCKSFILKEQDYKCAICKCDNIHNEKPLVFVLDHINGRANDNRRENLRLICPNCDSQLDTFKSKNKSSDRDYRYSTKRSASLEMMSVENPLNGEH